VAVNSRRKGKNGELEACSVLRSLFGWVARRTQQRTGWSPNGDSPDIEVEQTPALFWEIKRVQALNVPRALTLAAKQCGRRCPVLLHRPDRSPNGWMLTIRLADLPRLVHAYTTATDSEGAPGSPMAAPALPVASEGDCAFGTPARPPRIGAV
jgi:hypothetical protein